jgi:hypothetical protein
MEDGIAKFLVCEPSNWAIQLASSHDGHIRCISRGSKRVDGKCKPDAMHFHTSLPNCSFRLPSGARAHIQRLGFILR